MSPRDLARELQKSDLLTKLLDALKAGYVQAWEAATDISSREKQWGLVRATEDLREHVDTRIRDLAGDGEPGDR